ncbi:hypothetical protein RintRC_5432 [Richelia intracellularis]|nr:hypothetical protein RintRC_5432 [Richelia intracellularis]
MPKRRLRRQPPLGATGGAPPKKVDATGERLWDKKMEI